MFGIMGDDDQRSGALARSDLQLPAAEESNR